jgi:hypothetical protein
MIYEKLLPFLLIILLPLLSCATLDPKMERLIRQGIVEHVSKEIESGRYKYEGEEIKLESELFNGWIIEKNIFKEPFDAESYYEEKYKGKKDKLLDIKLDLNEFYLETPESKPSLDRHYDIRTYWLVYSCVNWLNFVSSVYKVPLIDIEERSEYNVEENSLFFSFFDLHCYRLINPERIQAYDVIFITLKDPDFKLNRSEKMLEQELNILEYLEYNELLYRYAFFIKPLIEYTGIIKEFSLLQLLVKRSTGGRTLWGIIHAGWEKRIRDTYIFILTGKNVKIIIQTFYHPRRKVEIMEKEIKTILDSIRIK